MFAIDAGVYNSSLSNITLYEQIISPRSSDYSYLGEKRLCYSLAVRRRKGLKPTVGSHGTTIKANYDRCIQLQLHLFFMLDQHTPEYLDKTFERFNDTAPLNLQTLPNSRRATIKSNDDIPSQRFSGTLSPLKMHPIYPSDRVEDLCHPIEYGDCPNPEPVDIVLPPSSTTSDSPDVPSSSDEEKPLKMKTLMNEHSEARNSQPPPPVVPSTEPHRSAKKNTWLLRLCIKLISKLNPKRTSENCEKPRHTKKRDRLLDRRMRGDGGEHTNPGVTQPFCMDPIFGGAAFGGAAFAGPGAGPACADSCGDACGC